MCTVSWGRHRADYTVLFNRDESRRRQEGAPPSIHHGRGCTYLSPVDRDAGGTWIWVNHFGVTSCILNSYPPGEHRVADPISRGLLLKSLACQQTAADIGNAVCSTDLSSYKPFFILAFDAQTTLQLNWDGSNVTRLQGDDVVCPLTTSGYLPEEVTSYRRAQFADQFGTQPERSYEKLAAFQSGHDPDMPAHSVLMVRKDARTVSQTHVKVNSEAVNLCYFTVSEAQQIQPAGEECLSRA